MADDEPSAAGSPVPLEPGFRLMGPSTRRTRLTTGEIIQFDRDGLREAVERSKMQFIPEPVEHLHYLPPVGRVAELRLVEHEGHAYVAFRDEPLAAGVTDDLALAPPSESGGAANAQLTVTLSTEPRNFDEAEFVKIRESSPVDIGEIALHAELPPIVWSFVIVAGTLVATKAFVTEFFKELGHESAHSFVEWLRGVARRARQGEREQMAEFRFPLSNGIDVLAFCPFHPTFDVSMAALRNSLENLGAVAAFASEAPGEVPEELRQVAFIWDSDRWRLAWWASDAGSFVTPWFQKNAPAPDRFLGYAPPTLRLLTPYMPGLPGAEPVEIEPACRPVASPGMSAVVTDNHSGP